MSVYILQIYIYCFIIFHADCYILIPLKIYNNNFIQKFLSLTNIEENDLSFILYSKISIGEPRQNAIFIISPDEYNFYMISNRNNNTDNSYYDFRISKSNNIYLDENNNNKNIFFMSEKFFFEEICENEIYSKEIGVENINLVLYLQKPKILRNYNLTSNINSYIIFGLKLTEGFDRVEYSLNLIRQLKRKNITKNYRWFIYYKTSLDNEFNEFKAYSDYINNIEIIIGAEPHELYTNIFQDKNLQLINAKSRNGYVNWGLYFNKICYYENNNVKDKILFELNNDYNKNNLMLEDYLIANIKQDLFFINSPIIFFDSINKNFFCKLFQQNKCFITKANYLYIYCENRKEIENYIKNNFKDIFFKNQELNYEFVLGYQDLFIKYDNKLLFLMVSKEDSKKWTFGIPFLKKYLLIYDYDHKVIGFYKQYNKKYLLKENNSINNIIKIFLIILLFLVFGIFGFIISKNIYGLNRKKRLNELQENYKYKEKNIDKQKDNINYISSYDKDKLIELKMEKI